VIAFEEAQHYALQLLDILEYGTKNCKGSECEAWEIINEYAPNLLENFEGVEDFYNCDYYREKYYKLFLTDPNDCDIVNNAYRNMRWGKCPENTPELMEIKVVKDSACYVPPPTPGPLKSAFLAYNEGKYREAIDFFKSFIDSTEDPELKAKYYLTISKIYYSGMHNYPESRKYALKAASFKENWGEPYMLIGKLYASSGPICGPGRGWDSQIVTWAAVDKFIYAKKIDPSVADEANKWIREYSKYMPSKEDIFQRTLREGDPFLVPCWIQERTTIRVAKK
jgi:tetratricopeptide (TPR) repeat protein